MEVSMRKTSQRIVWGFSPIQRVKASKKIYSRKKVADFTKEQ